MPELGFEDGSEMILLKTLPACKPMIAPLPETLYHATSPSLSMISLSSVRRLLSRPS